MAEKNTDNSRRFVPWSWIAGSLMGVVLLGVGGMMGYLVNTSVTRDELAQIMKADEATRIQMNARIDTGDARTILLSDKLSRMAEDLAGIRAVLENRATVIDGAQRNPRER